MKYVMLTKENASGISEVFHSVVFPEGEVPEPIVSRWNILASSSPVVGKIFQGYQNVMIGSKFDEESQELTLAEDVPAEQAFPAEDRYFALLVDNVIVAIMRGRSKSLHEKFAAAFSDEITVIRLENDDDPVDMGYTYNGSTFFAPEIV